MPVDRSDLPAGLGAQAAVGGAGLHVLRWHQGFKIPSSAVFGAIVERFLKDIERYAKEHGVPFVHFKKGENKEELVRPLFEAAAAEGGDGRVVLIGVAQEKASVWWSWKAKGHEQRSHPHME